MAIDYQKLKNWPFPILEQTYTEKDTILYALGVGMGTDHTAAGELQYVYENNLQALPTMAVVLGHPGLWMGNPESGIDLLKVVHGEQKVTLHQTLPASGTVTGTSKVVRIVDKGEGKGALVIVERAIHDKATGALLASVEQTSFCRANGGFTQNGQPGDSAPPADSEFPQTAPDLICDLPTRPETALIYRLSGDRNPLHVDPATAERAGFASPILHGLATYGVAGHAILKSCCDYRADGLKSLAARFSSPVFPGETIRTEIWRDGSSVRFQSRVLERDKVVLSNGRAEIA